MAASVATMRATGSMMMLCRVTIFRPTLLLLNRSQSQVPLSSSPLPLLYKTPIGYNYLSLRCAASKSGGDEKKSPSRLVEVNRLIHEAEERYKAAGGGDAGPVPQITLDQVTVSYARSGGPGGQNVNKLNTKVDMRFNVKNANWLSERVREKIMQMEKNRINKDGEIVISSTKTRTQKGNTEDALAKLQAIIDAASYVPPPPSQETVKKIAKLSAASEHKRLDQKKNLSQKKAQRRSRDGWD